MSLASGTKKSSSSSFINSGEKLYLQRKDLTKTSKLEENLLTAEERATRELQRTKLSGICLRELTSLYNELVQDPKLCTPRQYRRLKKKYSYLKFGIDNLKEAAFKPYVRIQPPISLHQVDRRLTRIEVALSKYPEIDIHYDHPRTISYREKVLEIENYNFKPRDENKRFKRRDKSVQCTIEEMHSKDGEERLISADSIHIEGSNDEPCERFELEEIPLDEHGNPIGQTTGFCEWCGNHILPIPSLYDILNGRVNKDTAYCCDKYRKLIEEVAEVERHLQAELDAKKAVIDISCGKPRNNTGARSKSFMKQYLSGRQRPSETLEQMKLRLKDEKIAQSKQFLEERKAKEVEKRRKYLASMKHIAVDTFDLPWDPYMTAYEMMFGAPDPFKDVEIYDPLEHCYANIDVRLVQSGIYEVNSLNGIVLTKSSRAQPPRSTSPSLKEDVDILTMENGESPIMEDVVEQRDVSSQRTVTSPETSLGQSSLKDSD